MKNYFKITIIVVIMNKYYNRSLVKNMMKVVKIDYQQLKKYNINLNRNLMKMHIQIKLFIVKVIYYYLMNLLE